MSYKLIKNNYILDTVTHACFDSNSTTDGLAEAYRQWLAAGNVPDPADPLPPTPPVYKEKNSIILQIVQAGKYDLAEIELAKLPNWQQALWNGAYKIAYDDAIVRSILATIGMDAETVMSNATNFGHW